MHVLYPYMVVQAADKRVLCEGVLKVPREAERNSEWARDTLKSRYEKLHGVEVDVYLKESAQSEATQAGSDPVNRPAHYTSRSVECIVFTNALPHSLANSFKYLWRNGMKDESNQEIGKAKWYLHYWWLHPNFTDNQNELRGLYYKLGEMESEFEPETFKLLKDIIQVARKERLSINLGKWAGIKGSF